MTREEHEGIERTLMYKISLTKNSGKLMSNPKLSLEEKIGIQRTRKDYVDRLRAHRLAYFDLVEG